MFNIFKWFKSKESIPSDLDGELLVIIKHFKSISLHARKNSKILLGALQLERSNNYHLHEYYQKESMKDQVKIRDYKEKEQDIENIISDNESIKKEAAKFHIIIEELKQILKDEIRKNKALSQQNKLLKLKINKLNKTTPAKPLNDAQL